MTCISGGLPCTDPACPSVEIHSLQRQVVTYRRLLASAKSALTEANKLIMAEFEYAATEPGYEDLIVEMGKTLKDLATPLTSKQRILTHMLGMGDDVNVGDRGYRNHYSVSSKSDAYSELRQLEDQGLVVCSGSTVGGSAGDNVLYYFIATEAGMSAIGMSDEEKARTTR